jgi:hypothetical protein
MKPLHFVAVVMSLLCMSFSSAYAVSEDPPSPTSKSSVFVLDLPGLQPMGPGIFVTCQPDCYPGVEGYYIVPVPVAPLTGPELEIAAQLAADSLTTAGTSPGDVGALAVRRSVTQWPLQPLHAIPDGKGLLKVPAELLPDNRASDTANPRPSAAESSIAARPSSVKPPPKTRSLFTEPGTALQTAWSLVECIFVLWFLCVFVWLVLRYLPE